jgi:hypothetical protein
MNLPPFFSAAELTSLIDAYFNNCDAAYKPLKRTKEKTMPDTPECKTGAEPATLTGLALFLNFNSRQEFEDYEANGPFAAQLKRARLRIEAVYEKKLHQQSPAAAMFALKSLGWDEKADNKTGIAGNVKTLTIEIIETGFQPSDSEKNVIL